MKNIKGQISLFDILDNDKKVTPEWTCAFTDPVIQNGKPAFKTEDEKIVNLGDNKPVCSFSGHICNKKSIWEVAESLEKDCPHICCRKCTTRLCGARCNGSKIPKCDLCARFNPHIEQPPAGWGKIGWCHNFNRAVNANSYCQEFDWNKDI